MKMAALVITRIWIVALLAFSAGASPFDRAVAEAASSGTLKIGRDADGTIREIRGLRIAASGPPEESARLLIDAALESLGFRDTPAPELRLERIAESLSGRHITFRHRYAGVDVVDSDIVVEFSRRGFIRALRSNLAREPLPARRGQSRVSTEPVTLELAEGQSLREQDVVGITIEGVVRFVTRLIVSGPLPHEVYAVYVDPEQGVVRREERFFNRSAHVFDPNPVATLNDASLRDLDDSASAVPLSAYVVVDLPGLNGGSTLSGPHVRVVDTEAPTTMRADPNGSLVFTRDQEGFEEVMAYFHLDRSQRYLQSLGYNGAQRILPEAIDVDAHGAGGADNSFFVASSRPGFGRLSFGDGGVDDAEDADILLHEYGHAIQESISPGAFFGARTGEGRAMGEGFGDYWAFSGGYEASLLSGRDPFCVGDWDARCGDGASSSCGYPPGADCLRRTDSAKTMDDFATTGGAGTEHRNGEIWSSALRRIFVELVSRHGLEQGRRNADTIVLEGYFGLTSTPTFRDAAMRMIDADRELFGGANAAAICGSMIAAKILSPQECPVERRGDLTLFQSGDAGLAIPDGSATGIRSARNVGVARVVEDVYVQLRVDHPASGELTVRIIAPDGRSVILQTPSSDGSGIDTTYGLETQPAESLAIYRGLLAAGDWTLEIVDSASGNAGTLVSWGLIFRFAGDAPFASRPVRTGSSRHLLVVANAPGAAGTNFVSDARVYNRGSQQAFVSALFTPSGLDGRARFSAMGLTIAPGQTVSLDDVVRTLFGTAGTGTIELLGDVENLVVTSRTYNRGGAGTFGQFIGSADPGAFIARDGGSLSIPQLQNTPAFRANVGIANIAGEAGTIRLVVFDESGVAVESRDIAIEPFGHQQVPILGGLGGRNTPAARAEVSVIAGGATVGAYGSVVDNVSGDSIYIPGSAVPQAAVRTVPAVFRGNGAGNTRWRTDLWLSNPTPVEQSAEVVFHDADGIERGRADVRISAGGSIAHLDVLESLLGLEEAFGKLTISSSRLLATSRIWTPGGSGSFGQFVAARGIEEAVGIGGLPSTAIQLEISSAFRTNLGFTEIAGQPASVRVRVFDAGGDEVLARDLGVAANGQVQLSLEGLGAPRRGNMRASFEVVGGAGRIAAYASVIDNRTGDPIFVPARR